MRIPSLLQNLKFIGEAEGDRRTYYVFQASGGYVVASSNGKAALNITVVDKRVPGVIQRRFGGREVTTRLVVQRSRRLERFAAMNALYVMVALGAARKLRKRDGKAIVFKIKR